jgi:hypothetical protein
VCWQLSMICIWPAESQSLKRGGHGLTLGNDLLYLGTSLAFGNYLSSLRRSMWLSRTVIPCCYLSMRLRRRRDNHMTAKSSQGWPLCLLCRLRGIGEFLCGKRLQNYRKQPGSGRIISNNHKYYHNYLKLWSQNLINCSQEVALLVCLVFIIITWILIFKIIG